MKNVTRAISLASALAMVAVGASAQRTARDNDRSGRQEHRQADPTPANGAQRAPDDDGWESLGHAVVNGSRDRDDIRVARAHNPLTRVLIRVEDHDIELYDMEVTFADGSTFAPQMRLTFREGERSRQIDLPGNARVVRSVRFRYGNLPGGGRARVELLGRS